MGLSCWFGLVLQTVTEVVISSWSIMRSCECVWDGNMHVEVKEGAEQLRPPGEFGMCPARTPRWLRVNVNNRGRRYHPPPRSLSLMGLISIPRPFPWPHPLTDSLSARPGLLLQWLLYSFRHIEIYFFSSWYLSCLGSLQIQRHVIQWSKPLRYEMEVKSHKKKSQNGGDDGQSSYISHICWEGGKNFTDNKKTTGINGPHWAEQKRNTWFAIKSSSSEIVKKCPHVRL